jgi:type IX secretion system substrate protein
MKAKLLLTLCLIIPVLGFVLTRTSPDVKVSAPPPPPPTGNISDSFLVGIMDAGMDYDRNYVYSLNFNVWQKYLNIRKENGIFQSIGWDWFRDFGCYDQIEAPLNHYDTIVTRVLNYNAERNIRTLMDRPKIELLAFGQRSDYQCEDVLTTDDLWFYSFNSNESGHQHCGRSTNDGSSWGNGVAVKYCRYANSTNEGNWVDNAGYAVDRLKANNEQCWNDDVVHADGMYKWLIKPRIRIDSNFAHNNQNTQVCRIDVYNYNGDGSSNNRIISVDLLGKNFLVDEGLYYNGRYLEEFNFFPDTNRLVVNPGSKFNPNKGEWGGRSRGNNTTDDWVKADIQVYWYGNCDMWLDYVRVDNEIADQLFKGVFDNIWLTWEAQLAVGPSPIKFYIEEFEFNHLPCMAYVSRKLKQYSGNQNLSLMSVFHYPKYMAHLPYWPYFEQYSTWLTHAERYYIDSVGATEIFVTPYPFAGRADTGWWATVDTRVPNTLPFSDYNPLQGRLCNPYPPANYDTWLQNQIDNPDVHFGGDRQGVEMWMLKKADQISKDKNIPFINMMQAHLHWSPGVGDIQREPTNEELKMTACLPVTYGARGITYYTYGSWGVPGVDPTYGRGLTEVGGVGGEPRIWNAYGQKKWDTVKAINARLKKWGPTLMTFDNTQTFSYIYRFPVERDVLLGTYFADVQSYAPDPLDFDNPAPAADVPDQRFLQAAVFRNPSETRNRYFMLVNKRCSPFYAPGEDPRFPNGENGGRRYMSVKFDANADDFANFNNWKIVNVENNSTVLTFDKRISSTLGLGWFKPGEGRLYKIAPVMAEGGTLITDENVAGITFDCIGVVYNGNKNITIGLGTTINFKDNAKIVMNGGNFTAGNYSPPDGPRNIRFRCSNALWDGMEFNKCGTVNISNSIFENIRPIGTYDSVNYAIKLVDCFVYNISNNTFTNQSGQSSGAINSVFIADSNPPVINPYIGKNTFDMNTSNRMIVKVQSFASNMIPVLISWNTFTHEASGSASGIFLSGINGCAVKNNTITNYLIGVNTFSAGVDLYKNNITSGLNAAKGLSGASYTAFNMADNGDVVTAGYNNISNDGSNAYNIDVKNSYFLTDYGQNVFNISVQNLSKHLNGHFPNDGTPIDVNARYNCFKDNGSPVQPPVYTVTWGEGGPLVDFVFDPYLPDCTPSGPEGSIVVDLGNGVYDTLGTSSGGGGGESNIIVITPKTIYDSICVEMRIRNYGIARNKCIELLTLFPDSLQSLDAVFKLYLASKMTDTSAGSYIALKTFYEALILNHPGNFALVKRCNYLVQKCKVLLRQYSSAMAGFEQIINQNPYSYEGLVARWDYMATHLLDSLSGGAVKGEGDEDDYPGDTLNAGQRQFTKEERSFIKQTIIDVSETSRDYEEKKVEILKEKAKDGDVSAVKELKEKMALKDVIKTDHPHNMLEHIKIVNSDIRKVFAQQGTDNNAGQNLIPVEFTLSQNYPNPFNPVTKIKFDIPSNLTQSEAKGLHVKLIVYDLLGREVKTLVNEFKKAGYYEESFDGSNFATGVYFYRLEAGEFVQSKKMVLIK